MKEQQEEKKDKDKDKHQEGTPVDLSGLLPEADLPGLAQARKLIVAVIGFTVLAVGVCLIVLPGPAFVVIPTGLAILASEFVWARRLLRKAKQALREVKDTYLNNDGKQAAAGENQKSPTSPDRGP